MAVVTAPSGGSLLGKAREVLAARRAAAGGRSSVLTAVLAKAREHVVTAAALASADFGAFHWGNGVGLLVTGASLLLLDFAVRG